MAEYVYPAVFHPNDDGSYTVRFRDLPGCITEGKSLGNAMYMAEDALTMWIEYSLDHQEKIPAPSPTADVIVEGNEFVNLIRANIKDGRAVRRTVSLPKWMDDAVIESGLSLSRVLQDALKERLGAN